MNKLDSFSISDFKADSGTNITWSVFKNKLVNVLNTIKNKINEIIDGKCEVVVGSYVGKCELKINETTSQTINLGFRPSAVEVYTSRGEQRVEYPYAEYEEHTYGGLALDGAPLIAVGGNSPIIPAIEITNNGFICRNYANGKRYIETVRTCEKGKTYYYKAYKNCTRKDFS